MTAWHGMTTTCALHLARYIQVWHHSRVSLKKIDCPLSSSHTLVVMANASTESVTSTWEYVWSIRDRRVDDWFLMSSPWYTLGLCVSYWVICLKLGPQFMANRKPYDLKRTIQAYNVFQIALSAYMLYEACAAGWLTHYSWICQDIERDADGNGYRMAAAVHLYFLSKFTEFADTFFNVLRKKFNHVSRLQLIHHGVMPMQGYLGCRWLPGGHETLAGTFNCLIHVLMYSYFLLASLGFKIWWKKYLTTLQMFQFVCIFVHSSILVFGFAECGYPWQISLNAMVLMILMFMLFLEYYIQAYRNKRK